MRKKERVLKFYTTDGKDMTLPLAWIESIVPMFANNLGRPPYYELECIEVRANGMVFFAIKNQPLNVFEQEKKEL